MAEDYANEREAIFAEEAFVVEAQVLLHEIMEDKGVSRADLARAMNVSRARITQIFSDECKNFTVRLLAKAMHALGETPVLTCDFLLSEQLKKASQNVRAVLEASEEAVPAWSDATEQEWLYCAKDNGIAQTELCEMVA